MVSAASILRVVWDWSYGGLPAWLRLPGAMTSWSTEVHLDDLVEESFLQHRDQLLDIKLGPKFRYQKSLVVPKRAKRNLVQVISVHVAQATPNGGRDLIWTHKVLGETEGKLSVSIHMFRKDIVERLNQQAADRNCKIRTISDGALKHAKPLVDNRSKTDRALRFWNVCAVMLVILIVASFIAQRQGALSIKQQEVQALSKAKNELARQAVELKALYTQRSETGERVAADMSQFYLQSRRLPILLDLTSELSDQSWISEFSLSGSELRISILSEQPATDIISKIAQVAWVDSTHLDGPVSFDTATRRNRFDLLISINERLDKQ